MTVAKYLDLRQLFEQLPPQREANRALGLELGEDDPLKQVDAWRIRHLPEIEGRRWSRAFERYRYRIGLILGVLAFLFGVSAGAALLSYRGTEPVNVVYFLAVAVVIPLVTMGLSLLAMMRASRPHNALVHLAPASWIERMVQMVTRRKPPGADLPTEWAHRLVIVHSQMMAFWFSLGLLLALVGIVATRDIAFGWSTTLAITSEGFHRWVEGIALPWRSWFPSAVPSADLITQSHFFRLGGVLKEGMVDHAAQLGAWWRFLAMATLTYAVGLRLVLWGIAGAGLRRAIRQTIPQMPSVQQLLHEMNLLVVQTQASENEGTFVPGSKEYSRVIRGDLPGTQWAIGWAIEPGMLRVALDALGGEARQVAEAGGRRSLEEDQSLVGSVHGEVVMAVKAWEPPTREWGDFLLGLCETSDRVVVVPLGMPEAGYLPEPEHVTIWAQRLGELDRSEVWLCRR